MVESHDVVVVGGGVIGLTSAFALARAGRSVAVVDPAPGSGSSWAAAGMLAPGAESTPENAHLVAEGQKARADWSTLINEVAEVIGSAPRIGLSGSLFVGADRSDEREWARYFGVAQSQGITSHRVLRSEHPEVFEGLGGRINSGWVVADDAYVDPDDVLASLVMALEAMGARIVRARASELASTPSGVVARTEQGDVGARCGLATTGYDPDPPGMLARSVHRVRPVRGVSLRLKLEAASPREPMVRGFVHGRPVYAIRRPDGTVVVGATSDESSERVAEAGAVRRLLEDATELLPGLDTAELQDVRVGLRPATASQHPFFEHLEGTRWAWSNGYFRHGYLLAPLAAERARCFVDEVLSCA